MIQKDGGELVRVDMIVDGKVVNSTEYETEGAAESVLAHMGFAEIGGRWLPIVFNSTYAATISLDRGGPPLARVSLTENGFSLYLEVVSVPYGYGFRFSLGSWVDRDPIMEILTTGLVTVRAVGTWPSVDEARGAGFAFFRKVQELVGADLLVHLIALVEEQWQWRRQERSVAMGLESAKEKPPNVQNLKQSLKSSSSSS